MDLIVWIILFCLIGGGVSVLLAASLLILPAILRTKLLPHLVSFAIGTLLGAAFLGLLPHAISSPHIADPHRVMLTVLLGLLSFFLLEKLVLWRHEHGNHAPSSSNHQTHTSAEGFLILIGDAIHNFIDGILIAAAFLIDIHLGIVTSLAIAAHEVPQEVGDFIILLNSGFTRKRALIFNILSSLSTVVGGLLAYFSLQQLDWLLPYLLAVAASSFIYIAVADLIPGLNKRLKLTETAQQLSLIASGVIVIYLTHSTLH